MDRSNDATFETNMEMKVKKLEAARYKGGLHEEIAAMQPLYLTFKVLLPQKNGTVKT